MQAGWLTRPAPPPQNKLLTKLAIVLSVLLILQLAGNVRDRPLVGEEPDVIHALIRHPLCVPSVSLLRPRLQFGLVWAVVVYNQQTAVSSSNPVLTVKGALEYFCIPLQE